MGILEAAKGILGFGFLGLAFLMAYLGYRLLRAEAGAKSRSPSMAILSGICFYLIVTILLMVVAGFFEFYRKPVSILVHFPQTFPDGVDLPKIKVHDLTQEPDEQRDIKITVEDQQQILVVLESLVTAIKELRQTAALQAKANTNPNEIGIIDEN